jgi:hypothetical protein
MLTTVYAHDIMDIIHSSTRARTTSSGCIWWNCPSRGSAKRTLGAGLPAGREDGLRPRAGHGQALGDGEGA